jgi:hypothetical protein
MKPIVQVKEGRLGSVLVFPFILCLCGFAVWCHFHFGRPTNIETTFICAVWLAFLYFPIDAILHPKSGELLIDGDDLVWIVRAGEGVDKAVTRDSIPLGGIATVEIIFPLKHSGDAIVETGVSRDYSGAQLFLISKSGERKSLPVELWPGVYFKHIVGALRERIPSLRVVEKIGSPDAPELSDARFTC